MLFWEIVFVPKTGLALGVTLDLDLNLASLISTILASDLTSWISVFSSVKRVKMPNSYRFRKNYFVRIK